MSKKKKLFVVIFIICGLFIVLILFLSNPMQQYLSERKINNSFSKIKFPNSLTFIDKADFGDPILGNRDDWGVQFHYNYTGDNQKIYDDIVAALEKSGYSVEKNDGWVIIASNTTDKIRIVATLSSMDPRAHSIGDSVYGQKNIQPQAIFKVRDI